MNTATSTSAPTLVQVHIYHHKTENSMNGWESTEVRVRRPDGSWRGSVDFNYTDSAENRRAAEEVALAKALRLEKAGKPVDLDFVHHCW